MQKSMKQYEGILFDLDDTLVDFRESEIKGLKLVHEKFFKENIEPDKFIDSFNELNSHLWTQVDEKKLTLEDVKIRFKQLTNSLLNHSDLNHHEIELFYQDCLGSCATWFPSVQSTLSKLKEQFKLGVITNGFSRVQRLKFNNLSMDTYFDVFVISEEVHCLKPSKDIFEIALEKLDLSRHEVLMVGDTISSDYRGAMNAGIDFCWINKRNKPVPAKLIPPKYTIPHIKDLPAILKSA